MRSVSSGFNNLAFTFQTLAFTFAGGAFIFNKKQLQKHSKGICQAHVISG